MTIVVAFTMFLFFVFITVLAFWAANTAGITVLVVMASLVPCSLQVS